MRSLSLFDHFSQSVQQRLFVLVYFILRIILGLYFLLLGLSLKRIAFFDIYLSNTSGRFSGVLDAIMQFEGMEFLLMSVLFIIGVFFILGFFTRLAAIFAFLFLLLLFFLDFGTSGFVAWFDWHIVLMACSLLFCCGGGGHIFGINGLIVRTSRHRASSWFRFLFG